ncbi:PHF5-like protein [Suhomyces tanzawaensis NRRL Y-17324]|uniref:PHF5-like protein n=1 Tax=Suhomyces tanzawaensis NRRL Y-17324 TaxID=984487 RepID=A0A1E4SMF5_9ASCO|nr:PHF5-like protein [Suhomyces tanzawaensis NRRL Y-17324]ODV80668.1 PHF5-like protein [Suhomyces tanzawaensis NRRL Y-17324]
MSRHQYDLIQCMKQTGPVAGLVCQQCDGRCPVCDSYVKPTTKVTICSDCSFGHLSHKCIMCSNFLGDNNENGTPAFYCLECVRQDLDREGCPRVINVGSLKADMIVRRKKA